MSRSLLPMLLFHEVCHSSKIYLLIEGLKLENGILKEVGSNESDVFACLSTAYFNICRYDLWRGRRPPLCLLQYDCQYDLLACLADQ